MHDTPFTGTEKVVLWVLVIAFMVPCIVVLIARWVVKLVRAGDMPKPNELSDVAGLKTYMRPKQHRGDIAHRDP